MKEKKDEEVMPAHSRLSHDVCTLDNSNYLLLRKWEFGASARVEFQRKKKEMSVKSSKKGEKDEHSRLQESIILIKLQRKELTSRDE